jgi:hypothetical protein
MRKIILLAFLFISLQSTAQLTDGTYYVAAKTGLSIREKADPASKVLEKIPYGTKVTTIPEDGGWKEIVTESLTGYWKKVKYNNKTGYIVDSYLLPWPPPKLATIKDLKQYLAQVAAQFGQKLVTKSGSMQQLTESGWELTKQLYKNGAEWHQYYAYEYNSDTYFLPDFSLQQGFLLCRLIPEFKEVFGEKDEFPTSSKIIKKGENEFEIKISRTTDEIENKSPFTIEKIKISFADGAYYEFEMYMQDNQLVIFFSGGV